MAFTLSKSVTSWVKGDIYDNFTFRSSFAQNCREKIQQQPKYETRRQAYLIENTPYNHCEYTQQELDKIETFLNNNNEGNKNPYIELNENEWKPSNNILMERSVMTGNVAKILVGQKECYTKVTIPKGTILGQYIGHELMKHEWDNRFKGTKMRKLKYRMQFLCCNTAPFGDDKNIQIFIDPFEGGTVHSPMTPLHKINDCRANVSCVELTEQDKQRQNVEFISVLCNGWGIVLIRATKTIRMYQSLWLYYGHYYYGLLFANKPNVINNQNDVIEMKKKTKSKAQQIAARLRDRAKPQKKKPPQIISDFPNHVELLNKLKEKYKKVLDLDTNSEDEDMDSFF